MPKKDLSLEERRQKYSVPALEKGLSVLELLSEQAIPMSQAEMARSLGRQPGELFRMLACLEGRGYVRREPLSGAYALTLRMFELSRIHSPNEALLRAALPLMRELADQTRESCHLSILNNNQVLVIGQEESPRAFRLSVEVGSHHPVLHTSSGRILAAALVDEEERLRLLETQEEWREATDDKRAAILHELSAVAERGYEHSSGERFVGGRDLGVLVGSPGKPLTAALTIAWLAEANGKDGYDHLLGPLTACAKAIADRAGLLTESHDHG